MWFSFQQNSGTNSYSNPDWVTHANSQSGSIAQPDAGRGLRRIPLDVVYQHFRQKCNRGGDHYA